MQYIEPDSPMAAAAIVTEAMGAADRISGSPETGSIVPEFNDPALREVFVKRRYRMMYRVQPQGCYVVAFLHHARDVTRLAKVRSFDV